MPGMPAVSSRTLSDAGLDSKLLDCWQTTLALGLLAQDVPSQEVLTVLGGRWWFDRPEQPGSQPRLDFRSEADALERVTGLRPVTRSVGSFRAGESTYEHCDAELAAGRTPLVVADGFVLPWCPYYRNRHIEHSFAVTATSPAGLYAVDGYDNSTEWGPARPLETVVGRDVVDAIDQSPGSRVIALLPGRPYTPIDPAALLQENIEHLQTWAHSDPYAWFVEENCTDRADVALFEAFCEACWTIGRRRGLYAIWLDGLDRHPGVCAPAGFPDEFRDRVVSAWAEVNRFAYLALRRVRAGRTSTLGAVGKLIAEASAQERALAVDLVAWSTRAEVA